MLNQSDFPSLSLFSQLTTLQESLSTHLKNLSSLSSKFSTCSYTSSKNNLLLLSLFIRFISSSFKALQYLLRFLSESEIMSIASTCQTMYRMIYSPLGYRIIRALRPVTITISKEATLPTFSQNTLENLCSDRSLVNLDDDDKSALILTMKTNLIATKQKIRQLEFCIYQYESLKRTYIQQTSYMGGVRQQIQQNIFSLHDQIEKLNELLHAASSNTKSLREEQQKLLLQREHKIAVIESEREKLTRQKQLLIKKIKSQQKQKEEGLVYAREVSRAIAMLNKLTHKK